MIKPLLAAALCMFASGVIASDRAANQGANPRVLSLATFHVTDHVSVQLPKWKMADGKICQSYVASAVANAGAPQNTVQVTFGQICGLAKVIRTGFSGHQTEEVPGNLEAMRTVTVDGLASQLPVVSSD